MDSTMTEPDPELMRKLVSETDDFSAGTEGMLVMVAGDSGLPDSLAELVESYGWTRDQSCRFDQHYRSEEDNTSYAFAPEGESKAEVRDHQRTIGSTRMR